jgi:hypothetical protein
VLFLLGKLLFFYQYALGVFARLVYLHLVINFLHKHHFRLSLLPALIGRILIFIAASLALHAHSSPPLPIHPIITLYPQKLKNIPTDNIKPIKIINLFRARKATFLMHPTRRRLGIGGES